VAEISGTQECTLCREVEIELENAALEYFRVTKEMDEEHLNAARHKMVEVQQRFNIHKKTHKRKKRKPATS
jgi:arsenate reductase-like glutaredoxin family protein